MSKKGIIAITLLIASTGLAENDYFAKLDKNKDGKVTEEEWVTKNRQTSKKKGKDFDEEKSKLTFHKRDLNKDGVITRDELEK